MELDPGLLTHDACRYEQTSRLQPHGLNYPSDPENNKRRYVTVQPELFLSACYFSPENRMYVFIYLFMYFFFVVVFFGGGG